MKTSRHYRPQGARGLTLLDVSPIGVVGGPQAVRHRAPAARGRGCAVPLILISSHSPDDFADLIAESPAIGFVSKSRLSAAAIQNALGDPTGDAAQP
jgi:hypothetical protein